MSLHHRQKNHKIDRIAIEYFLRKVIFHKRFSPEAINYTTEEVKQNLQLINDEGKLKNAALLLFGKDPQRHFVSAIFRIGRFGGENNDFLSQDTIEGNILHMGDKVVEVLKNKYLISLIHYEGMVRVKTLEIPAILEIMGAKDLHLNKYYYLCCVE